MSVRIIVGDVRDKLAELPPESVHCVVTSPPYWGLRDYGVAGQIGLEPDFRDYTATMVEVFREVRRALRSDGTLWLNLGDSYAGSWGAEGRRVTDSDEPSWHSSQIKNHPKRAAADRGYRGANLKPKDLCGIPWRVAFALQQPDYLGRIKHESDRAWLAALTDGEGCITILETASGHGSGSSFPPVLQVRMCDPECIEKAMSLVGSTSENPKQYPPSMEGQRPAYQWRIHGRKAADTIAEIYPWILIKRKQAIVAWNHQAVRDGYETKRGVKIPVDALEKQKVCRELIQRLNKRAAVDLPSWMIEPPQPYGPGWYLRQDLIWSKPNPMPESATDRCTKAHEYLFLLAKSARYHFEASTIREAAASDDPGPGVVGWSTGSDHTAAGHNKGERAENHGTANPRRLSLRRRDSTNQSFVPGAGGLHRAGTPRVPTYRNKRSVWEIATQPFTEAHFATFPPALVEPCILAGCPEDGVVLDPFGGAGTTGLVADRLGRDAILIEINPEYADMARRRINGDAPLFPAVEAAE